MKKPQINGISPTHLHNVFGSLDSNSDSDLAASEIFRYYYFCFIAIFVFFSEKVNRVQAILMHAIAIIPLLTLFTVTLESWLRFLSSIEIQLYRFKNGWKGVEFTAFVSFESVNHS